MKKLILLFITMMLFGCSSGGDEAAPKEEPKDDGVPVAVNDDFITSEDTELFLTTLLNNDTVVDNTRINSFEATTTQGGTVEDERTRYVYTPKTGFVGNDTFTYTLCDNDSPANCSTATVTISVTDEGNPIAISDAYSVVESSTTVFDELLLNDDTIDNSVLTFIDGSETQGTVVLDNTDKTVLYTPQTGYIGEDSFSYTICDDDTPDNSCSTAKVTITVVKALSFNIPTELQSYYNGLTFTDISDVMFQNLETHTVSNHVTILSYGQRHNYLYDADEDLNNAANVILMYSGESRDEREWTSGSNSHTPQTFNTEHVYPQSRLVAADAVTDLHHLRSCDADVNSNRLNYPFVDGTGTYQLIGETWFPGDEWKGDVARMMLYLNVRYGETFTKVGSIELFLKWNAEDPVSAFEEQRNEVIYAAQGNRNPFIDNPYLATLIWGGDEAENKWQ